jgi:hypothetical protein
MLENFYSIRHSSNSVNGFQVSNKIFYRSWKLFLYSIFYLLLHDKLHYRFVLADLRYLYLFACCTMMQKAVTLVAYTLSSYFSAIPLRHPKLES